MGDSVERSLGTTKTKMRTVYRTIVIKGEASWVTDTLKRSFVSPEEYFQCAYGEIREEKRLEIAPRVNEVYK